MGLVKCPRCELNYILDGGNLCTVCRKEVRGESEQDDITELCTECGENPAMPGSELCASCLKEITRNIAQDNDEDVLAPEDPAALEIDSVSTMDEIAIDIGDDMDAEAFDGEEEFTEGDEEDEDEEDDGEKNEGKAGSGRGHKEHDDDDLLD